MPERQLAMADFVETTGVQAVRVKTFVPIHKWRSKLKTFPYATNGLVFERKSCGKLSRKFAWMVRCVEAFGAREAWS